KTLISGELPSGNPASNPMIFPRKSESDSSLTSKSWPKSRILRSKNRKFALALTDPQLPNFASQRYRPIVFSAIMRLCISVPSSGTSLPPTKIVGRADFNVSSSGMVLNKLAIVHCDLHAVPAIFRFHVPLVAALVRRPHHCLTPRHELGEPTRVRFRIR